MYPAGLCILSLAAARQPNLYGHQLAAVLRHGGDAAVLTNVGYVSYDHDTAVSNVEGAAASKEYQASLLLDRAMVKPTDTLHVTGECYCCYTVTRTLLGM